MGDLKKIDKFKLRCREYISIQYGSNWAKVSMYLLVDMNDHSGERVWVLGRLQKLFRCL